MELLLFLLFLVVSFILEIRAIVKSKQKKEIVPYIVLMALVGMFGILYFSNPDSVSVAAAILKLIGKAD